jgi:hypothetical protein
MAGTSPAMTKVNRFQILAKRLKMLASMTNCTEVRRAPTSFDKASSLIFNSVSIFGAFSIDPRR